MIISARLETKKCSSKRFEMCPRQHNIHANLNDTNYAVLIDDIDTNESRYPSESWE